MSVKNLRHVVYYYTTTTTTPDTKNRQKIISLDCILAHGQTSWLYAAYATGFYEVGPAKQ